jgi:hypothetical protein
MNVVEPRLRRSYFVRVAIVVGIPAFFGAVILWQMRRWTGLVLVAGIAPTLIAAGAMLHGWIFGARRLDQSGVTRRDGKRFAWSDFKEVRDFRMRMPGGEFGPVTEHHLVFSTGKIRIFPITLENAGEVLAFIDGLRGWSARGPMAVAPEQKRPASAAPQAPAPVAPAPKPASPPVPQEPYSDCPTCGELGPYHQGFQKGGREDENTWLPAASANLVTIKEIDPNIRPTPSLQQCPSCKSWFLHTTEYEYLVYGSEDTQTLSRISEEEAKRYLGGDK